MNGLRIAIVVRLVGFHVLPSWADEPVKESSKDAPGSKLGRCECIHGVTGASGSRDRDAFPAMNEPSQSRSQERV